MLDKEVKFSSPSTPGSDDAEHGESDDGGEDDSGGRGGGHEEEVLELALRQESLEVLQQSDRLQ